MARDAFMTTHWDKPFELIICDDDVRYSQALADQLKPLGFHVQTAKTLGQAGAMPTPSGADFLIAGYRDPNRLDVNQIKFTLRSMAGVRLIALLPEGLESYEELLLKTGVSLVLSRDLPARHLAGLLVTQGELRFTEEQNFRLRQLVDGRTAYGNLLGGSAPMRALYRLLDQVARTDAPVLIHGETGTERVDVARAIHAKSERALHPIVAIDCSRKLEDADGVAIFGPVGNGQFASGPDPVRSVFARAGAGVVVLHRVECLGQGAQQRLLDFMHRPFFQDENASNAHPLARLMVTSAPELPQMTEGGKFLRELYYRLSILQVRVPPLRERREDIPMLAQHLLRMAQRRQEGPASPPAFSSSALLSMFQYGWPGNLEELAGVIREILDHLEGDQIDLEHLPGQLKPSEADSGAQPVVAALAELALKDAKRVFESEYFIGLLRRTRGNMTLASRYSRVGRPYLYKKIREYGIEPDEYR
jgi:two-component system response regulator HydG